MIFGKFCIPNHKKKYWVEFGIEYDIIILIERVINMQLMFYFLLCYLLGSIPSGLIIGKSFRNVDIRDYGSGNLGGTNAIRVLGRKLGLVVTIMDMLKGGLSILFGMLLFYFDKTTVDPIVFGIFAVIGHIFPVFARFKGGKAVATSGGILLFYNPIIFVISLAVFFIVLKLTKYVSVSSTCAAIFAFINTLILGLVPYFRNQWYGINNRWYGNVSGINYVGITVVGLFVLFILYRHIPNYKRLLKGNENKIGQKKVYNLPPQK